MRYSTDAASGLYAHLTPTQKGAMAEAAVTLAANEIGLTVLRPTSEGRRYDLVVDIAPRLLRIQCKLARHTGGALLVPIQTNRYTPNGYVCTRYNVDEVDAIAAFAPKTGRCYLLPIAELAGRRGVHLRLLPTKNNQAHGIRWARDYEFEVALHRYWNREAKAREPGTPFSGL